MPVENFLQATEEQIKENDVTFHLTDMGNAERLVKNGAGNFRYCFQRNTYLNWVKTHWQYDKTNSIEQLAKKTVRNILKEAEQADTDTYKNICKHAARSESAARIRAMIDLAKSEPGVPIQLQELDTNQWLLNVQNGTLDLKTGTLREPQRPTLSQK